jgi:hypothetical protein
MGIGYADFVGNCRLVLGSLFIVREGRPNPFVNRRRLRSLYAPKAERILRVLLGDPERSWRDRPLSREARVSVGLVSNTRRLLADREWVMERSDGFLLMQPERLLVDWASNYRTDRARSCEFYSLSDIGEVERGLASACRKLGLNYALTSFSAAARYAPSVRYQKATAYVTGPLDEIARSLQLKQVDSGATVSLLAPHDEGVYYRSVEIDGTRVVSPVQAYLELKGTRARGEEAADFLLETEIQPRWRAATITPETR